MAIGALVVGIVSIGGALDSGYPGVGLGIIAAVLAWRASIRIKRTNAAGAGLAIAGLVLGVCGIVLGVAVMLMAAWLTAALGF
jgi:uncharacterized protein DUF4190